MSEFLDVKKAMAFAGEDTPAFPRSLPKEVQLAVIEEMYKALLNYSDNIFDLGPILAEAPRHDNLLELLADADLRSDHNTVGGLARQAGSLMTLQAVMASVSASQGFRQEFSWPKFLSNMYTQKEQNFDYLESDNLPLTGVIVLEGPDCTGKTTLANHFVKNYGATYIHGTWSEDIEKDNHNILMSQIELAMHEAKHGGLVIIDRSWISEFIYADVFRGGTNWPDLAEDAFVRLLAADAIYIFCMPFGARNTEKHRKRFLERAGKGEEMYEDMGKIVEAFQCFLFGLKHAQALADDELPAVNPDPEDTDPDLSLAQEDDVQEGDEVAVSTFEPFRFNADRRPALLGKFWDEEEDAMGSLQACIFDCDIDGDYEILMHRIAELKGILPTT